MAARVEVRADRNRQPRLARPVGRVVCDRAAASSANANATRPTQQKPTVTPHLPAPAKAGDAGLGFSTDDLRNAPKAAGPRVMHGATVMVYSR